MNGRRAVHGERGVNGLVSIRVAARQSRSSRGTRGRRSPTCTRQWWSSGNEYGEVATARVVILGAGISGHTAALHLQRQLKNKHEIVVVSPNANWNWIPSNIWVGVGKMTKDQV